MYQSLYASVPDTDAYLKRININHPVILDKAGLDELIFAHQCYVPFENLDVWLYKKSIPLEIEALYEKVVVRGRGGYCFELNALFTALLNALGFEAYACMCRITRNKNFVPLTLHRGIIVTIDGQQYFCDVGYGGPMPAGAIPIRDGAREEIHGDTFFINKTDTPWWTLSRVTSDGSTESVMQFYTMPQEAVDFITMNEYCSKSKDSVFCKKLFVNRRTENGNISITDQHFAEIVNKKAVQEREITQEELPELLEKYFNIKI